jgi:hypothetical protein
MKIYVTDLRKINRRSRSPRNNNSRLGPQCLSLPALSKTAGTTVRFSHSKYNTLADMEAAVDAFADILQS